MFLGLVGFYFVGGLFRGFCFGVFSLRKQINSLEGSRLQEDSFVFICQVICQVKNNAWGKF